LARWGESRRERTEEIEETKGERVRGCLKPI